MAHAARSVANGFRRAVDGLVLSVRQAETLVPRNPLETEEGRAGTDARNSGVRLKEVAQRNEAVGVEFHA